MEVHYADESREDVDGLSPFMIELLKPGGLMPRIPEQRQSEDQVELAEDVTPFHVHELVEALGGTAVHYVAA